MTLHEFLTCQVITRLTPSRLHKARESSGKRSAVTQYFTSAEENKY